MNPASHLVSVVYTEQSVMFVLAVGTAADPWSPDAAMDDPLLVVFCSVQFFAVSN